MSAVEEIVGQHLLSPRPRFGRWQAERVFFSPLGLDQIIFLPRLKTLLEYNFFGEILLIYLSHLGLKQKFPPPYYFFPNTLWLLEFWNFMEYIVSWPTLQNIIAIFYGDRWNRNGIIKVSFAVGSKIYKEMWPLLFCHHVRIKMFGSNKSRMRTRLKIGRKVLSKKDAI